MNKIKTFREENNLTLEALSKRIKELSGDGEGISVGHLSHLENGSRANPSKETMEKIAKALGRTVVDVFFPDDCTGGMVNDQIH